MKIHQDVPYVGVNNNNIDLFEEQYDVQKVMAYNFYVVLDEKIAILIELMLTLCMNGWITFLSH